MAEKERSEIQVWEIYLEAALILLLPMLGMAFVFLASL